MEQFGNRGGMVVGPSHNEGGVPFMLQDTGRHIEEEGMEINIPRELSESPKKYSFRGTNAKVLDQILNLAGLSVTDKVTNVRSGDIVICVRSAWDQKKRIFNGTIKEILHEINTSGGCKPIIMAEGRSKKAEVTARNGGSLPKGVKPRVKDWQAEDPNSPRWKKKKQRIEELSNGIHKLRLNVSRDIQSPDERTALTALIVAVMDRTAERIGNDDSADNGHFGVTGFRKKHISVVGSTVHLDYVGKSGTKHEKSFSDARIAKALKKAIKNAHGKFIFETSDGFRVKSDKVNRYLQQFNISAKDMRGYNANRWIIELLKKADGKWQQVDVEKQPMERKKIFNKAVKETAIRVGHGSGTLKKHYMIPELPIQYVQHGRIIDMKNLGYYLEGGELAKGIEVEKEHRNLFLKLKKRLAAQGVEMPITEQDFYKEIAKAHIKERKDYYDLLEKYVEKYTMANGGPTPLDEKKQEAQELAKKFIDSLSSADIQTIKQEMQAIVNTSIVEEETKLNDLIAQKKAFKEEIKQLYEKEKLLTYGEEKTKIWNRREFIDYEIGILEPHILHQQNIIKAIRNGGDTTSFTDKKGLEHKKIPFFSNIKTDNISFDEETILTDAVPAYIPFINEQMFKRKGYVFDAIRIARDEYLIAINGYNEKRQAMSRQEERKVSDFPHPDDSQQGYVITTLDQLALISDYYFTKARAEAQKKADESTKHNEEYYDKLPRERRERHLNQKGFYHSLPVKVKKIITQEAYEALSLEEKEKLYKPFKKYGPERLKSKLDDQHMWVSYHNMYERFINPAAVSPRQGTANPEVFQYWENFRDMMKWKIKDIQVQREVDSEIRKIALETSFGESNTTDVLKEEYGILVKRQNGTKICPDEIEQIRKGWVLLNKTFGNLVNNAKNDNLKISHTGLKYVFASKAAGMYVPSMKTIAVSNKFGDAQFDQIFSHETAHWIDGNMGALIGKRHATDDFESTAGRIASTFRKNMNAQSDSDYVNSTVECFARAMEQYFAFENYGEETELLYSYGELKEVRTYHSEEKYVSKENFNTKIKPLIQQFLAENQEWFKFGIEVPKESIPEPVSEIKTEPMQPAEITPHKEVKANQTIAINEVITKYAKFKDLKPMEAGMLYSLRNADVDNEISNATGLKEQIYAKLQDKYFIEHSFEGGYTLSEDAKEFIEKVNSRLETRKSVKAGTDLFPETANIPEFTAINISKALPTKSAVKNPESLHNCAVLLGRKGGLASAKIRAKMNDGGTVELENLHEIFGYVKNSMPSVKMIVSSDNIDIRVGEDLSFSADGPDKEKMAKIYLAGLLSGYHYPTDEMYNGGTAELSGITPEFSKGGNTGSCDCFSSYLKKNNPDLCEKLQQEDVNSNPKIRAIVDAAYRAWEKSYSR